MKQTAPFFDIILVNYNSTAFLLRCLDSIYASLDGMPAAIHVQDNASQEDVEQVRRRFPEVILTRNTRNLGFAAAVNQAIRAGRAPYVALVNPDSRIESGFFKTVLDFMSRNSEVGVLGPKVMDPDGTIQGSARGVPTPLTAFFGRSSFLSSRFPNNAITRRNVVSPQSCDRCAPVTIDWVSGACMVIRRQALDQAGLLDERFYIYWEDADLCRRINQKGWRVVYCPEAKCYHFAGKSSSTNPLFALYHFHRSCYLYFEKYADYPSRLLLPFALAGLGLRCALSMGLSRFRRSRERRRRGRPSRAPARTGRCPKQVLRIVSRLNIGGPATHISILTKKIDDRRFKTSLVVGRLSPHEGDMSYLLDGHQAQLHYIPELQRDIDPVRDAVAFFKLVKIVRRVRPDIVHTHMAKAGALGRLAAFSCKVFCDKKQIKTVHTFHGHVLEGYFGTVKSACFEMIERVLARFTTAIIAISKTQKWQLTQGHRIVREDKVHRINLGFDLSRFVACGQWRGGFRQKIGVAGDVRLIGIVGRLTPIKNHFLFLDSARLFMARNKALKAMFLIIGDGELRGALEARAERLGLLSHVLFCGWERDIHKVYADLDVVALTSNNEGTPVSLIEAMASGVSVITTGVGGVADLLGRRRRVNVDRQGFDVCERGVLCPKCDPEAFAAGLHYLVARGAGPEDGRIQDARRYVLQNYSDKRLVEKIEALYTGIGASGPR